MKQARVAGWSDVGGREAALIQRCAAGEQLACTELVAEHQRMVVRDRNAQSTGRDGVFDG